MTLLESLQKLREMDSDYPPDRDPYYAGNYKMPKLSKSEKKAEAEQRIKNTKESMVTYLTDCLTMKKAGKLKLSKSDNWAAQLVIILSESEIQNIINRLEVTKI